MPPHDDVTGAPPTEQDEAARPKSPRTGVASTLRSRRRRISTTRYAHYRDLGFFIGSGAVEAGCKAVIGQRLELSGCAGPTPAPPASSPCAPNCRRPRT